MLLSVDENGRAILTNFPRRIPIYHFSFRDPVTTIQFAPSGRFFAVGIGRRIEIWHTPETPDSTENGTLEFAPFVLYRKYVGHFDDIQSIEWSGDSRFFISASNDRTIKVWSLDKEGGFASTTLAGHRGDVKGAWFSRDQETIWSISKDGTLFQWEYMRHPQTEDEGVGDNDESMQWRIVSRHHYDKTLSCAAFYAPSNLLVAGFSDGVFTIHELPDWSEIQTLSISQSNVDTVSINATGEWLAFGSSKLGQLLVWEWQSESYILKQQGHYDSMNSLTYTPDGQKIITCADDGKIKVWDTRSGFCIVTFTEHTSGVTACQFSKKGNVLFTASLDGSVRAWDLIRYRNFRTFTAPTRTSFSSLAIDPSGEVVCAGSLDVESIFIWNVQTGQLLDRLAGHEGPISSISFSPDGSVLVSGSWDNTVRIWSIFSRTQTSEPLFLQANVLAVAFRPDSKQLAVSTLDGQLTFWSINTGLQTQGISGRQDISGGRRVTDRRTAANIAGTKSFNSITYAADGSCVLAAGNSKYICLYEVGSGTLVKKFTVSVNLSLDGTQQFLNSRNMTEAGPRDLIDDTGELSDQNEWSTNALPGSRRGVDASLRRKQRPEVRVADVAFAPTGRSFCAATTEGLLVYSLDAATLSFDPFELDVTVTPRSTLQALEQQNHLVALIMAFRLNSQNLIKRVFYAIPAAAIDHVVREIPDVYLARLMRFVAGQAEDGPHLEFCLRWIESILSRHGRLLRERRGEFAAEVRVLMHAMGWIERELRRLSEGNGFMLDYLLSQPLKTAAADHRKVFGEVQYPTDDGNVAGVHDEDRDAASDGWIGIE